MDAECQDERAAGVCSGDDPYKELELYLEKVNEEIGEVFDRWKTAPVKKPSSPRIIPLAPPRKASLPPPPLKAVNGHHHNGVTHAPPRRLSDDRRHYDRDYALSEWSDTLLAEFNSIIARELHQFQTDVVVKGDDAEDVFLTDAEHATDGDMMRIKAYRSRSWDNYNVNDSDSSGHGRGTSPPSPSTSSTSDTSSSGSSTGIHHRTSGLARVLRRHRAQVPTVLPPGEPLVGAPVLVRVSSLPDTDTLHAATGRTSPGEPRELLPVPRIRNAHSFSGLLDKMAENKHEHEFALCGIPNGEKESEVVSIKGKSEDVLKNECESVGSEIVGQCVLLPSVVLNHNGGFPSNSLPDGKVSKGYTNVPGKSPKPSALASKMLNDVHPKSSLPFSNICLPEDKSHSLPSSAKAMASIAARKECSAAAATSDEGEVKCAGSLPDLVIAEKQQVADDVTATAASRRQEMRAAAPLPTALHNFLTKIRPRRGRGHSPSSRSPSRSFSPGPPGTTGITGCYLGDSLLSPVDAGTQTSPGMSRSSSFTWVSDCSSLLLHSPDSDTLDDDNRSTTSTSSESPKDEDDDFEEEYDASSMGEEESACSLRHRRDEDFSSRDSLLSSSSPRSVESPERDEEQESGIGTASPPRSKGVGSGNKARRKETWERLRKRPLGRPPRGPSFKDQEVWIRREHVETQTTTTTSPNDDDNCCGGGVDVGVGGGGGDTHSPDDTTSTEDLRPADSSSGLDETTSANSLSMPRVRAARPQCLAVTPSPGVTLEQSGYKDHPSPSTASLKMDTMPLPTELGSKSSSAPMLIKKPAAFGASGGRAGDGHNKRSTAQSRSQSERHLAEIEAGEACKWLRAAGFPQYAQMYEDMQFPIDVSGVQKDHPFLDPDSLQSLYRRLSALNHCAKMKVEHLGSGGGKKRADDSDEDDNSCALSENWTFQHESRRWSRVCDVTQDKLHAISASSHAAHDTRLEEEEDDSYELDDIPVISPMRYGSLPPCNPAAGDADLMAVRFRRTGSERLRDGAKALLRRMESLKTRRRKRQHRDGVIISGPQVLDVMTMNQRMRDLNCVDVSPVDGSPPPFPPVAVGVGVAGTAGAGDDSCSDGSASTTPHHQARHRRRRDEPGAAMSDSEMLPPPTWGQQYLKDANSNHTKVLEFIDGRSRGSKDTDPRSSRGQIRTGSLNLGRDSQRFREKYHQHSLRRDPTSHRERYHSHDDSTHVESDREDSQVTPRHKASVVRWHSFQRGSSRPDSSLFRLAAAPAGSRPMGSLSCGQLLVLRKLALLKLTACMERYCPTHRTGWNWELPKFIRKIKAPDYKDKTVFGVPLLLSLQRNGQALPKCIQMALKWLRTNALDQVGLFRKSGVRSRIQRLKLMTESQGDAISYEGQQAYDVADMVKQYFRELPEALLTNKLSETFIAIFQHVPEPLRRDAVQCVLLLLPDEHREALQTLVEFLEQVSAQSALNQMTASNLAVCLAPSLFHLHHAPGGGARSASASPRRKTVGAPDPRELGENRAAHDCLLYLVHEHRDLFMVGEEMLTQCHFSYMEQSIPVALEELGAEFRQDWRGYLYACTTALLKEAREKSRGWVSVACSADPQVDMSYRKVGDGHPLRLWRVSTEVEAPPLEVLHRVLRERHVWDHSLLKWRVVQQLDQQVEVFQYVCANMAPSPAKDFCVLRSWRSDLPKGACVVVETSVEHPNGSVMLGGVRGIVLASRYLIEPCGSGRSRIMHLSRVDTKGRTPEWYNKSYGHICALHLSRIRGSFKHNADGPESKV